MAEFQSWWSFRWRAWAIVASALCLAVLLYPPWLGGYRGWLFSPNSGRLDHGRLIAELAASLLAAVILTVLVNVWNLRRNRMPRRWLVTLFSVCGCLISFGALRTALQISRSLPPEELARLDGLGSLYSENFAVRIHNGSESWTVREVTVRLTLKASVPKNAKAGSAVPDKLDDLLRDLPPAKNVRDYRIRDVWIPPLETRPVSVEILSPPQFEFDQWQLVSAKGFKAYW